MTKLRVLDLFSGIGGFSLGLERTGGFETVAFCEIEDYPRRVLAKHWPDVPIYNDVKELTHERLAADGLGGIDIIVGGYPCQPFSHAGQRRGAEDDRHLWPEVKRLVASIRPAWCLFENVAGHVSMGLDEVLSDLEGQGYSAWPTIIPACAVDAPHRRDRVWIIANQQGDGRQQRQQDGRRCGEGIGKGEEQGLRHGCGALAHPDNAGQPAGAWRWQDHRDEKWHDLGRGGENVADAGHTGVLQRRQHGDGSEDGVEQGGVRRDVLSGRQQGQVLADTSGNRPQGERKDGRTPGPSGLCGGTRCDEDAHLREATAEWPTEPDVGRVAHGIPRRVDRLKCLGNAVVPQIPEMIGYAILEAEKFND